ncbi:MAG: hypothetical protein Q7S96_01445 [bacterium]|nr:hypothetical protein [bacterium]
MKQSSIITIGVIAAVVLISGGVYVSQRSNADPETEALAMCLTERGIVEYGAYWCPNCAEQKKRFGSAFKRITYIECAMPGNPQAQSPKCQAAGITGYPTWVFPDGNRLIGLQSLQALAKAASCAYAE